MKKRLYLCTWSPCDIGVEFIERLKQLDVVQEREGKKISVKFCILNKLSYSEREEKREKIKIIQRRV